MYEDAFFNAQGLVFGSFKSEEYTSRLVSTGRSYFGLNKDHSEMIFGHTFDYMHAITISGSAFLCYDVSIYDGRLL